MNRTEVLDAAKRCVCGDREQDYGSPERNFRTIANLWTEYLQATGMEIDLLEPHDVAVMLALMKIARISSGHAKLDNWVDLAGYAACGGELESAQAGGKVYNNLPWRYSEKRDNKEKNDGADCFAASHEGRFRDLYF